MSNLPLPDHGKFFDLNVPYDNDAKEKLQMLVKLGYEVVAFNNFVHSTTTTSNLRFCATNNFNHTILLSYLNV